FWGFAATCASGSEGRSAGLPNSIRPATRTRTVSPPNSSDHPQRPSSSKRSSSFADSTQSTTPKPQPTRPAHPPISPRLPLPEHPPGQRALLPQPPLLSDATPVPQRSRSHLPLESHRTPRSSSSSFAAPDLSPRGAGARRLA